MRRPTTTTKVQTPVTRFFALVLLSGIGSLAAAQEPPPIARYVPPTPDSRHVFVMDSAHILAPATIAALQDSARSLQAETGADIAWVTLPTLGGRAIEDATVYLGRTWGVGSKGEAGDPLRNRGLVILYIPDKSKTAGSNFRVEVGKGLQGTIIDSRSRAISAAMRDDLRAKRYDDGYMKGWNVAAGLVREDFASQGKPKVAPREVAVEHTEVSSTMSAGKWVMVVLVLAAFGIPLFLLIARRRRGGLAGAGADGSHMVIIPMGGLSDVDDDDRRRRRDDDSSSSSDDDSSSSDSGGGDFGGGGGFDGGGSSDSI